MQEHLKVKLLSLGAEARIIKKQEERLRRQIRKRKAKEKETTQLQTLRSSMRHHRVFDVRIEARASNLAYGFLRGTPLEVIEQKNHPHRPGPDWERVERMILKYGTGDKRDIQQKFEQWKSEGQEAQSMAA